MRNIQFSRTAATVAALGCAVAGNAYAAKAGTQNPCDLLAWQDVQVFDVKQDTPMTEAGWHKEGTPKELPGSNLYTNMCAIVTKSDAGRVSITLSFDSFKGKVNEAQIADWMKSTALEPEESEEKPTLVTLGNTTCESGKYNLPTAQADDSVADVDQHYIACDQIAGTNHVSLNIHVPNGKKADLPSAEQAKSLLDKSISRMKEKSFAVPDPKPAKAGDTAAKKS